MSQTLRRLILVGSFLFSQAALLLILRMPSVPGEGSWLQAFRGYFSFDQLSYAAIASTVAAGTPGLPEPFTETGHSYYPSLWYRVLGWVAAATGMSVPAAWTVLGWLLLAGAVAALGWAAYRISRLPWAPALVGPALMVGTLAAVTHDGWYTQFESHATLWGPFGALYVLNGEVAALSCLGLALAIVLTMALGPASSPGRRTAWLTVAAVLVGLTANVQTYAFFVGTGVMFGWLAAYGLLRSRSRGLLIATGVLILALFPVGRLAAPLVGALPVYGLFILCTAPGIGWLVLRRARWLIVPAVAFIVVALPQALIVAGGISRGDEFLSYRQDQSSLLGVPVWAATLLALPVIAVWGFGLAVQRGRRDDRVLAALAGSAFSAILMSFNDAWGFTQEPYRLWINSLIVTLMLLAPLTAWSISAHRVTEAAHRSVLVPVMGGAAIVLVGLSLFDFGAFRAYVKDSGVISFDSAKAVALASVTKDVDGLLTSDACLDPQVVKIATRKPVAYYNLGLAWPDNRGAIDKVMENQRNAVFDPDAMRAAGVKYLVVDSACGTPWPVDQAMGLAQVATADYADAAGTGTLSLWRLG